MAISLTDNIRIGQQKPVDDKYFNGYNPYTSIAEANSLILIDVRHKGLTVNINGVEYWYKDGIEDEDLVLKSNIDTSNLVPFTGADKDVKIGPHYFESDQGFKKTGGTATEALTANGGTYDLNNKADLVAGKVPASQSRSSIIVMDNSTYVITFTDATGAVQTIDLPLESLFKDANYNSSTKSLIVTLQDGTTRTIPLTDLVDLPEIVLSTSNPAVTPTTGQKVYFNTSLAKVWFNAGGTWVFAGNLISDSEKANITTAYNHSQKTGNPHGTTKSDIGLGNVENTADLDKPISTATQNALNNKQNKLTNPITGSGAGTTNRISKFTGNGTIGDSQIFENDTNIGIGAEPTSDKLEVDGNVKASGFKTTDGLSTQGLRADGGVFDLSSKADLDENGKVKATQIPSSSLTMNPTTHVITFTDATGVSQTIDLPIESLFKEASYNPETRKLTLELYGGGITEISLTDLVDLPEIVLSTDIPSVNPTEGKKVWFNTSSGKMWFNVGNVWVESPASDPKTTSKVVSTTTVGALNPGDFIDPGTTLQGLVEKLLDKTHYPTFVNPTFGLTNNAGLREVGSSFNVSLTFNFNRGQILGKLDNGIWNPTMLQDYRAGTATSYLLNGVSGSNNSASFNVTTILGNNNLNGSVTYATGPQPKDSKGNNYDNPLPSGTSPIQSTSFEGIYPYFYYKSKSPITPAIMQSAIANGQATKVLASSTGTITVDFDANGDYIAIAYPATSTTKTIWYVNALDNGVIPGGLLGGVTTLPCNSPTNLWSNVNFNIHVSAGLITQPNPIQLKNS